MIKNHIFLFSLIEHFLTINYEPDTCSRKKGKETESTLVTCSAP